jgi:hypothetical protein
MISPDGASWVVTGVDAHSSVPVPDPDAVRVELGPDPLGLFDFTLAVRKVTRSAVNLEAMVTRGNDTETVWVGAAPIGENGVAVLPFWDRRLLLTPAGGGVTVALTPDGDGSGWPAGRVPH